MAHEMAVQQVNMMKISLTNFVRAVVTSFSDGKLSPSEGIQLGLMAMMTGQQVISLVQSTDEETKKDILFVLENGEFQLPEGM